MRFWKKRSSRNEAKDTSKKERRAREDDRNEYEDDAPVVRESKPRRQRERRDFRDTSRKIHLLVPILFCVLALFLLISLIDRDADGLIGPVGKWLGDCMFGLFGFASYFLPPVLVLRAIRWRHDVREKNALFAGLISFFFLVFVGIVAYIAVTDADARVFSASEFYKMGVSRRGGGFFGNAIAFGLLSTIGPVGALLFCVLVFGLFLLFGVGLEFKRVYAFSRALPTRLQELREKREKARQEAADKKAAEKKEKPQEKKPTVEPERPAPRRQVYDIFDETLFPGERPASPAPIPKKETRRSSSPLSVLYDFDADQSFPEGDALPAEATELIDDSALLANIPIVNGDPPSEEEPTAPPSFEYSEIEAVEDVDHSFEELARITSAGTLPPTVEDIRTKPAPEDAQIKTTRTRIRVEEVAPAPFERRHTDDGSILAEAVNMGTVSDGREIGELPDEEARSNAQKSPGLKKAKPSSKYKSPPLDMLDPPVYNADAVTDEEIRANADTLIRTLSTFGIGARVVAYEKGPRITRYEIKPDDGTRVRAITNLAEEISMSLACDGIRIERIRDVIGVEVPNRNSQSVYLRSLVDRDEFKKAASKTTVCLGCDVTGKPMYTDIAKAPHLLIAGATGMGKSVCINTLIASILYKSTPDEVRLILVDPKKVEFTPYRQVPHLLVPVVTDPNQAAGALEWAVNEMERRFEILSEAGVPNTLEYNEGIKDDPEREYMSTVVIIIDEFNDLLMTASDSVEKSVLRIAQKARAAGMHLIIGTQRPDRNVINSTIKANIPVRIAFKVAQQVNSQVILDQGGAERLLDKGDMLAILPGKTTPIRMQGAFVSSKEIKRLTEFLAQNSGGQLFDDAVLAEINENARKLQHADDGEEDDAPLEKKADPKFEEAVEVAFRRGSISTSLLQRELEIGFGRGARIIDRMYKMGIVGESEGGAKPRKLLISRGEYLEMKYQQEQREAKAARKKEDEDDDY